MASQTSVPSAPPVQVKKGARVAIDTLSFRAKQRAALLAEAAGRTSPFSVARNKYQVQILGEQLFWMMRAHGYPSEGVRVLDPFAGQGLSLSHTYLARAAQADLWVIVPEWIKHAQSWGPNVKVHCGDSFEAINGGDPRLARYDVIILDNNLGGVYSEKKYCEHFDLVPSIFRYFREDQRGVLVVNYVRNLDLLMRDVRFKVEDTIDEHRRRRREFFGTSTDVVSPAEATAAYTRYAATVGRRVVTSAVLPRAEDFGFLLLFNEPA
jgi:hypothetical protein